MRAVVLAALLTSGAQAQEAAVTLVPDAVAQTEAASARAEAGAAAEALRAAVAQFDAALSADDQVAALGAMLRATEDGQAALREGLRRAAAREAGIRAAWGAERDRLGAVLAAMAGAAEAPEVTLLLHPAGPEDTARAGQVLSAVVPALRAEAARLDAQLAEIAVVRRTQAEAAEVLAEGMGRVQEARRLLVSAAADRSSLPQRFTTDPAELVALKTAAGSLDAFAAGLATLEQDVGAPTEDFAGAQGALPLPVQGSVLRGYDEPDAAGVKRPGLVLATAPRALVTAPWPATIRYRGPLLDHGNVMIVEPARGTLLVFAGMAEVFGAIGDVVAAGEPLGLMGGPDTAPPEFGVAFVVDAARGGDAGRTETLYVELRQDGQTVDPAAWFAAEAIVRPEVQAGAAPSAADG